MEFASFIGLQYLQQKNKINISLPVAGCARLNTLAQYMLCRGHYYDDNDDDDDDNNDDDYKQAFLKGFDDKNQW